MVQISKVERYRLVENPYEPICRDSAMYFSVTVDVHIIAEWNGFYNMHERHIVF